MALDRHFGATTYIVQDGKVLLHKHKKFGFWLPPGGHMEPNETPEEAALREVREEAGLDAELVDHDSCGFQGDERTKLLKRPAHVLLEVLEPEHEHVDLIFYGKITGSPEIKPQDGESTEFRWFRMDQLDSLEAPPNVAFFAKEAIKHFQK